MKIILYAFTETGKQLANDIQNHWNQQFQNEQIYGQSLTAQLNTSAKSEIGNTFTAPDTYALLFIGATGIAVRSIAPYVNHKLTDPAVLVMDECAQHVIPILSGHYGGGNPLAYKLARLTGATPVITTATDLHHCFAVDVFAKKNGLCIAEPELIKKISSTVLKGQTVGICSEIPVAGKLPSGLQWIRKDRQEMLTDPQIPETGIYIGYHTAELFPHTLHLIPQDIIVGIGCRKGKPKQELLQFLLEILNAYQIDVKRIAACASIDQKAEETGMIELAKELHVAFLTYSVEELTQLPGVYTSSEFVAKQMGVDNVCERSAAIAAGEDAVWICRKQAKNGMTYAIIQQKTTLQFI